MRLPFFKLIERFQPDETAIMAVLGLLMDLNPRAFPAGDKT